MFQFTHPGRGATRYAQLLGALSLCFNSRTPGGVRHGVSLTLIGHFTRFNSRTPGGVRPLMIVQTLCSERFQFTHPGRGATDPPPSVRWKLRCFNSRTPGGVRLAALTAGIIYLWFQFTHPGRGATCESLHFVARVYVSIHAPREGCDPYLRYCTIDVRSFNSRTPGGVRL